MKSKDFLIGLLTIVFTASIYVLVEENKKQQISYNEHIRPIINSKFIIYHGGVKRSDGLCFLFGEEALNIAESGVPAIIPGDAEIS